MMKVLSVFVLLGLVVGATVTGYQVALHANGNPSFSQPSLTFAVIGMSMTALSKLAEIFK